MSGIVAGLGMFDSMGAALVLSFLASATGSAVGWVVMTRRSNRLIPSN